MHRQLKNTIKDGLRNQPSTSEVLYETLKGALAGGFLGYASGLTGENIFDTKTPSSHIPNKKVDGTIKTIYNQTHSKQFEENKKNIKHLTKEKNILYTNLKDKESILNQNKKFITAQGINIMQMQAFGHNEATNAATQILQQYVKQNKQLSQEIDNIDNDLDKNIKQLNILKNENKVIKDAFKEEDYQPKKTNFISKTNISTGITGAFCGGYNGYHNAYKKQPVAHNIVRTNQQVYLLPLDNLPINVDDKIHDLQDNYRSYMFIDIFENNCDIHIIGNNSYAKKLREQLGLPKHSNDAYLSNGDLHFDDLCNALLDIIPQNPNDVAIANLRTDLNNIKNAQPNNNVPQNNVDNQRDLGCGIF